jgi:glutamate decarboxylase
MPLAHPHDRQDHGSERVSVNPVFTREPLEIPRLRLPDDEIDAETAYQVVHDELMLDGNARLNLATFVTTWMEPQARTLMAECFDKNMIDKDEYPRTAELEMRCVHILADLWHSPASPNPVGCSTTGSSEACMLAGLAMKRRWQHAGGTSRPNIVMGINVQVCWDKFANYWEVEPRLVPMEGDRLHLTAEEVVKYCDANTIGVVAILGSTFDGSYEPVADICAALDGLQAEHGWDIPVHVDGASGAMIAPFCDPELVWDFRLPRVCSINTSGHKYGLVYPGVGWVVWRDAAALPDDLVFRVNYLGGEMPTFALNFSRPGAQVAAQYYTFLRLGRTGYERVQSYSREVATSVSARIAKLGPFQLRRQRAAGVRVHGGGGGLLGVRRVGRTARARLARPGVHVPGEPRGPGGAASGGTQRFHPRHGGPVRRRPGVVPAAAAQAVGTTAGLGVRVVLARCPARDRRLRQGRQAQRACATADRTVSCACNARYSSPSWVIST